MTLQCTLENNLPYPWIWRFLAASLKPLQRVNVDSWASLHVYRNVQIKIFVPKIQIKKYEIISINLFIVNFEHSKK